MRRLLFLFFPVYLFAFGVDMNALRDAIAEVESAKNPYAFCVNERSDDKQTALEGFLDMVGAKYKIRESGKGTTIFSIYPNTKILAVMIANFLHDNNYKNYDVGLMQINRTNFKRHPVYYLDTEVNIDAGLDVVRRCYTHYLKRNAYEKEAYGHDQYIARNLIRALECYKYGAKKSFDSFENAQKIIARYNKKISSR